MEIHDFGHTSCWQVVEHTADKLCLVPEANETTMGEYPFRFRVTLLFTVSDGAWTIRQNYGNRDTSPKIELC